MRPPLVTTIAPPAFARIVVPASIVSVAPGRTKTRASRTQSLSQPRVVDVAISPRAVPSAAGASFVPIDAVAFVAVAQRRGKSDASVVDASLPGGLTGPGVGVA